MVLYTILLIVIWCISYGHIESDSYRTKRLVFETIVEDLETSAEPEGFSTVGSTKQYLDWIDNTFIPTFFADKNYKGDSYHWRTREFMEDLANYRVGPARLRQLRMPLDKKFFRLPGTEVDVLNYGQYSFYKEDKEDYCIGWKKPPCDPGEAVHNFTSGAWSRTDSKDIWGVAQWGLTHIYDGGGYIANLDINKDVSLRIIQELWDNKWIDQRTRGVLMEFTLYNANVNYFSVVTLLLEYPDSCGVIPHTQIQTFRIYLHSGTLGYLMLVCQFAFICLLLYLIYKEVKEYKKSGRKEYFSSGWNILEVTIIVWSIVAIIMYIGRYILASNTLRKFKKDTTKFLNFQHVATYDEVFRYLMGMLVFFYTIKLLRIFSFNKKIQSFLLVLRLGRWDLIHYFSFFIICYVAFAGYGYVVFGNILGGYSSIPNAMISLTTAMLGHLDYENTEEVSITAARLFFAVYMTFTVFILVNLLIIILLESFADVQDYHWAAENQYDLLKYSMHKLKELLGCDSNYIDSSLPTDCDDEKSSNDLHSDSLGSLHPKELLIAKKMKLLRLQMDEIKERIHIRVEDLPEGCKKDNLDDKPEAYDQPPKKDEIIDIECVEKESLKTSKIDNEYEGDVQDTQDVTQLI